MGFVAVATIDELRAGEPLALSHEGYEIALVQVDDSIYAIQDLCSHAHVRLSEGDVEGCAIECFLHGAQFDLRTGAALTPPASQPVAVYPVTTEGENILVDFDQPYNNQEN